MTSKLMTLLLLSCVTLYAPPTMAAEKSAIKPQLIKMPGAKKSSHGINIIKGKVSEPKETSIENADPPPAPKTQKQIKKKKKSANIISARSCAEETSPNQNTNLADSLKAYLSAKNQSPTVIDDILFASQKTNVDFELLIVKAMIESDLGRLTAAKNSSARGVFQYIDSTWLTLLKRYGEQIGHAKYAKALHVNPNTLQTEPNEDSPYTRDELLDLRHNTRIAALIKAHQTKDDERAIKTMKNNGIITATDHYIAHMMGIPLAKAFYRLLDKESPEIIANSKDGRFERAARLNPAFFNDHNGNALNAANAYQKFHDKISARYDKISTIYKQYTTVSPPLTRSRCNLPTVKTARL